VPVTPVACMAHDGPVRTALYQKHLEAGATMVDFHGFELPIQYSSIRSEHLACREHAGLFDVSHMGLFTFEGTGVREWLSSVSTQNLSKFAPGRCGYTHFLDNDGRIIDDMIFAVETDYRIHGVPNASMVEVMLNWLNPLLPDDASISINDRSRGTSILALQGPSAPSIASIVFGKDGYPGRFKCRNIPMNALGIEGWIQGTGYTGEAGVEIFVDDGDAPSLWNALLEAGRDFGIVPVGLGARDTLRLEKGYLLSGQDFLWPGLNEPLSEDLPENFLSRGTLESNVPFGLSPDHDFIGRADMEERARQNVRWTGLRCISRGPSPRLGHQVHSSENDDSLIGYITSGAPSPSLGIGIGMAYLDDPEPGQVVFIQTSPRKRVAAEIVRPPFL